MLSAVSTGTPSRLDFNATNAMLSQSLEALVTLHNNIVVNHPPQSDLQVRVSAFFTASVCGCITV